MTDKALSVEAPGWLRAQYAAVDANDFATVLGSFSDQVEVRFGNRPPALGRAAAQAVLADVHRAFARSRHRFASVWEAGDTTLIAFEVTYSLHGGSEVAMETFTVLRREAGLIRSMHVYIDEGPLRSVLGSLP